MNSYLINPQSSIRHKHLPKDNSALRIDLSAVKVGFVFFKTLPITIQGILSYSRFYSWGLRESSEKFYRADFKNWYISDLE